eukprot:5352993-Alexandrium_andersonii.AAC.1
MEWRQGTPHPGMPGWAPGAAHGDSFHRDASPGNAVAAGPRHAARANVGRTGHACTPFPP